MTTGRRTSRCLLEFTGTNVCCVMYIQTLDPFVIIGWRTEPASCVIVRHIFLSCSPRVHTQALLLSKNTDQTEIFSPK